MKGCISSVLYSPSASFILDGIKVYDIDRLTATEYMRVSMSNANPFVTVHVKESEFNYELYKIMYPEAWVHNREGAYADYTSRLSGEYVVLSTTLNC